jgi:hypothetical protein
MGRVNWRCDKCATARVQLLFSGWPAGALQLGYQWRKARLALTLAADRTGDRSGAPSAKLMLFSAHCALNPLASEFSLVLSVAHCALNLPTGRQLTCLIWHLLTK